MKKIKVYLQYPWRSPDSPYYKYLIENPPNEIEYLNIKKQKGVIIKKRKFFFSNFLKKSIRKSTRALNLPLPNAHLTRSNQKYDLIHCAHCLSLNKTSWVMDLEGVWQLWVSGKRTKTGHSLTNKILSGKNCKKIMPWTQTTANEIIEEFPELKDKIKLVYPALPLPKEKKIKHEGINLLFVGRYFHAKGGFHATEVFDILTKKCENVNGFIVSKTPKEVIEKYSSNKKIKFFDLMPQKKLFEEIYSKSDIFIYPGYSDTFGFALTEAMSFGIPIVTVDGISRKEIVAKKKTGFIIEREKDSKWYPSKEEEKKIVKELANKTLLLIKDKKLLKKMSKNCVEIIKNGRFSIKERNKKLKKIYDEVLK